MEFATDQNFAPNQLAMAEQAKLNGAARKADTQSVTKRLAAAAIYNTLQHYTDGF